MRRIRAHELAMLAITAAFAALILLLPGPEAGVHPESGSPAARFEYQDGSGLINVNTATAAQLELLPGIGPVKAEAIVEYRSEHGPFESAQELLNVRGIGEATLEGLIDLITVEDEE